ncbi:SDR family NAD(P)-dependent oxidoreductase [Allosalinactinospora lopnorensis]|uniref:SDR family NAD(P)-dependent oxidoreductase n=1 Tax=Allosalinactinospora lopnorensis TaxID=1352348 RepID=UPI0023B7CE76|nr:SDR family NAD(P)-dependent oxidoreductase [Allosalinactinospora lopnorensis]
MGLAVGGANSPQEFWRLRTAGRELFTQAPEDRWETASFAATDADEEDKAYQQASVFITGFDPAEGTVEDPAGDAPDHELTTQWLRHSLVQALDGVHRREEHRYSFNVGYTPDGSQHLEEACVLGGTTRLAHGALDEMDLPAQEEERLRGEIDRALSARYQRGRAEPSRFLPHQVGRLAMRGLLPPRTEVQMVDTACSSSLYAIDIGIKDLLMGRQDVAVCGGAFAVGPRGSVLFSKLQGLSERGAVHALDQDADGVVFSDGAGVVVLKRLRTALADGDRVLGVLKACGTSSDGKGKGIYAPNPHGQALALQRALSGEGAAGNGLCGRDVDWINAHATGTPAGDLAEFSTLRKHYGVDRTAVVTSNKSLIGHTGWAAGVVSLIETLLAMEHERIPGQYRFNAPRDEFRMAETELEITSAARDWPAEEGRQRTAAVSGFGFGGTNAHLIVAEPAPGAGSAAAPRALASAPPSDRAPDRGGRVAIVGWSAHLPGLSSHEELREWLGGGRGPQSSFGEIYPAPPFSKVRLPPRTVRTIDRCQLMILECAHDLRGPITDFWQEHAQRAGVFVGHTGPTRAGMLFANRCYLDDMEKALRGSPVLAGSPALPRVLDRLRERVRGLIPPSNEDAFPGMMPNVISARVANYFDLNGPNMTMDTGFGSALSAIGTAGRYLRSGELDFAVAGGINGNSLPEYRELVSGLLPEGAQMPDLAEGAFLFALATEEAAQRAGLPVLGYVGEDPAGSGRDTTMECGARAPERARFLGAAGGLAVLEALHRPAGTVSLSCAAEQDSLAGDEVAAATRLRLSVTGALAPEEQAGSPAGDSAPQRAAADTGQPAAAPAPAASQTAALAERFTRTDEYAPGEPIEVHRQVPVLSAVAARPVRERTPFLPDGAVVLTDTPELLAGPTGRASNLTVISTAPLAERRPGWHHLPEVTPSDVRSCLAALGRPVTHLRVLSDLTRSTLAGNSLTGDARSLLALHDAAYLVLQETYDGLRADASSFVALLLGAAPEGVPHPFTGLFSGLLKSAHLELDPCLSFGLFVSGSDVPAAVRLAEAESAASRNYPIVFDIDGVRKSYLLRPEPVAFDGGPPPAAIGRDSVVLAVGGARGITAEVLKAVAERFGPKIYLFGSNTLDAHPPETFAGDDEEFAAGRAAFIKAELAKGGGRTVAEINRAFDRMLDARVARRNLAAMAAHSGVDRVRYLPCDVRDPDSVQRAVDQVLAAEGRIDLLVNAAGRQRSSLIRDKDFSEFTAIRDLKVAGYRNLKRALRDHPPRLWCNFGSLLGYFGQLGEADYAAGNDFLASAATYENAAPGGSEEFTMGWTLWDAVGMGADKLTKAYFERAGSYSHMAVAEGVHHFVQELHAPVRRPSVVHLGTAERGTVERFYPGYLDTANQEPAFRDAQAPDEDPATPGSEGFYLRRLVASYRASATFECTFNLETDSYLTHHTVQGQPTLPGTFVTEIAAEAARYLVPGKHVIAFEDLRFQHFMRVRPGTVPAPKRIRAELLGERDGLSTVEVRITEDIVSPSGVLLREDRPHFTTRVLLSGDVPAAPQWGPWDTADEIEVPDPYHQPASGVRLTGPFVSTAQTRLNPRGKRARYAPSPSLATDADVWPRFTVPAILLDGLARLGVLDLVDGYLVPIAAPLSIRRIDLYRQGSDHTLAAAGEPIELYATPAGFDMAAETVSNRFVATGADGRVLVQMKDIRATVIGHIDSKTGRTFTPTTAAEAPAAARG